MIIFQILSYDQNLQVCNGLESNQIKKKISKNETHRSIRPFQNDILSYIRLIISTRTCAIRL